MSDKWSAYGFTWGQVDVERASILPDGTRVVTVRSSDQSIDVYVSPKGRSIRVFRGSQELTAPDHAREGAAERGQGA